MSEKVTPLSPRPVPPPPEPTPSEKLVARSRGVERLDSARWNLGQAAKAFEVSGDERSQASANEIAAEIEALIDGLAVGR
jgi:hypothetical protein